MPCSDHRVYRPVFSSTCLCCALYSFSNILIPEEYHFHLGLVANRDGAVSWYRTNLFSLELSCCSESLMLPLFTFRPLNFFLKLALPLPPFLSFLILRDQP